jgi:hypothetical protein
MGQRVASAGYLATLLSATSFFPDRSALCGGYLLTKSGDDTCGVEGFQSEQRIQTEHGFAAAAM